MFSGLLINLNIYLSNITHNNILCMLPGNKFISLNEKQKCLMKGIKL